MTRGKVKWFSLERGYGFIAGEEGAEDIFVHYSDIEGTGFKALREGDEVEFDIIETSKGLQAKNVRKIVELIE